MISSREEHIINGMQMVIDNLRKRASEHDQAMQAVTRERDIYRERLRTINEYDRLVQGMIKSNSNLESQWDQFRMLYQLTASDELLATAREKIMLSPLKTDKDTNLYCKECHRLKYYDPLYPDEL